MESQLLSEAEIRDALEELGKFAAENGFNIEIIIVGGAAMALRYHHRQATKDVDVIVKSPESRNEVWKLAKIVARHRNLPDDWLNDAAKGFYYGKPSEQEIFRSPGIIVHTPSPCQLLAMKLIAWRDDVDIDDAKRLLQEIPEKRDKAWELIVAHVPEQFGLKAQLAFNDLWDAKNDSH